MRTDFVEIVEMPLRGGFDGYIMVEDESLDAEEEPDVAALKNGKYIQNKLVPAW